MKTLIISTLFLLSALCHADPLLVKGDKVLFLGDSITRSGVKDRGYITLLSEELANNHPDLQITTIGAGISGNKVSDLLKRLNRDVLKKKPNVVMIYVGINDVWHWTHPNAKKKGLKGTTPEAYEAGLKTIIQKVKAAGAKVLLCTPTVIGEKTDGTNLNDKTLDEYAAIGRKVAQETGVQLLDLRTAFIKQLQENNPENLEQGILTKDTVHLNEKGNQLLAKLILEAFNLPPVTGIKTQSNTYYLEKTQAFIYKNDAGKTMPYRLFTPKKYDTSKTYPLVISFHGAGGRGNDNQKSIQPWTAGWIDDSVQKDNPCFILIPQCPKNQQWVDTPWKNGSYSHQETPISLSMTLAKEIVDKVLVEKSIDQSRIYVTGPSMGGYATWSFTMRYPELVAAATPFCGAADPSMAATLKNIPIWAFHGDQDNIVPFSGSVDMNKAITDAGGEKIKFTIYPGVKHDSYKIAWKSQELVNWLFQQKK